MHIGTSINYPFTNSQDKCLTIEWSSANKDKIRQQWLMDQLQNNEFVRLALPSEIAVTFSLSHKNSSENFIYLSIGVGEGFRQPSHWGLSFETEGKVIGEGTIGMKSHQQRKGVLSAVLEFSKKLGMNEVHTEWSGGSGRFECNTEVFEKGEIPPSQKALEKLGFHLADPIQKKFYNEGAYAWHGKFILNRNTHTQMQKAATSKKSRISNKLRYSAEAEGDGPLGAAHSVFARDHNGDIYKYSSYLRNQHGYFEKVKRFDGGKANGEVGANHINKCTKENFPTPHMHSKKLVGGIDKVAFQEYPQNKRFHQQRLMELLLAIKQNS